MGHAWTLINWIRDKWLRCFSRHLLTLDLNTSVFWNTFYYVLNGTNYCFSEVARSDLGYLLSSVKNRTV